MLWWFIGFWLASGAVLPAFLLLRMIYRWLAAPKIGPLGLHVLSGLVGVGVGALMLWFVCSCRDSNTAMRQTPMVLAVVFSAAQLGPPLLGEAERVASIQPRVGDMGQSAGDDASHRTDAAVPQAPPVAPLHTKLAAERGGSHHYARGPSVGPYITHASSRGIWLFAPNGNEGANN